MSEDPKWSSDPKEQAAFMNDLRQKTVSGLAGAKSRQVWLMVPAYFLIAAILVVAIFACWKISQLENQLAGNPGFAKQNQTNPDPQRIWADQQTKPIFMENGLTEAERAEFYHLAEGSEVFPLDWLRALENSETKNLFMDDFSSMGFLRDWDPNNKDGLPVGLTSVPARGLEPLGKMVGLNCAACHVGEMAYKGKRLRIDGAPNFLDTRTFFASLVESSLATIADSDKLLAFIARVKKNRADEQASDVKVSLGAKIIHLLKDNTETVLVDAMTPVIKKIITDAKQDTDQQMFDLAKSPEDAGKDIAATRKKWLANFDDSRVRKLLENSRLKKRLDALAQNADHEGTLLHTFEEIYIGVRLLKSRAEFLKKLGMVGTNPKTKWGPGRVDAFGSARAFLFQDGYAPVNPVSYPFIWGLYRINWFHYDNNTTSILQRNFGQALGVGGVYDPKTKASSLHPRNLYHLEALATKLKPPQWPSEIFGKIDQASADRGKVHYQKFCAACHEPKIPGEFNFLEDVDKIQTDPHRAKMFSEDLPISADRPEKVKFATAIGAAMQVIMEKSFLDNNVTQEEREKFARPPIPDSKPVIVKWQGINKYAARPLNGVWASGPFLHNGSVPTLDDLLKPAKDRPAEFFVGNREFDPIKLGYVSTPPEEKRKNYDTRIEGNFNTGHEYGAILTDAERKDLLEYLKGL